MSSEPLSTESFDVVIIGGALSGAATATLLLRHNPGIRVLVVEKSEKFTRRVGEATVEVSAYFLGRVLGLTQYLNESHLLKQGLRFWFQNDEVKNISQSSELGGRYLSRVPSYQIDRSTIDEEVLRRACESGATLLRPATVTSITLNAGGRQLLQIRAGETVREVSARWVVDASGLAAMLARKQGWWVANEEHPTAAAWSRWKGVKDLDGRALAEKYPAWSRVTCGIRNTATNHIIGDGWWSWWIPLKGGDTSVGVVFDQRLVKFPQEGGKLGERLKNFLMDHPVGRELLVDAVYQEDDVHWRKNLPYYSTTFAGDGFVLVGDAAAFLDPFYSPGMDWISFTCSRAAHLITRQRLGEPLAEKIAQHNEDFAVCYRRWFEALYKDKYHYMGEYDLMGLAFKLDYSLYIWGVAREPFHQGEDALLYPPFTPPSGALFHKLMWAYNRRFATIARRRRRLGTIGKTNSFRRTIIPGYTFDRKNMWNLVPMLMQWLRLELTEGRHTWFEAEPASEPAPVSAKPATDGSL